MNPLDRLTTIISRLMGKNPDDPDVLEAVVEVVMAMREPDAKMLDDGLEAFMEARSARFAWYAMIDALLTEGEG
jgi:hypothetical protein